VRRRRRTVLGNGGAGANEASETARDDADEATTEERMTEAAAPSAEGAELRGALAAIALARTSVTRARAASAVAGRLVEAARDGDTAALSALLRAHPRREATVWRVSQFRLGDVTPSVTVAHDDPCAAVLGLARPGDGALVAGELVAVDADGSAWTAVARTDDELVVQLPSPRTIVGPAAAPDAVGPLLLAWRRALGARPPEPALASDSLSAPAADPAPPPTGRAKIAAPTARTEPPPPPPVAEPAAPAPVADTDLARALDGLDAPGAPLDRLRAALQADLAARLNTMEARLTLAAEEGARIAVARALDEIRDELRAIREQLHRLEPPRPD
jgi:hypothetical protein